MLKHYNQSLGPLSRVLDAVLIGLVWLISYWLRFNLPLLEVTKGFPSFSTYAALTPVVILLWAIVFSALGVYSPSRLLRRTDEAHLVLKAHAVALVSLMALTYLISDYRYSRGVMVYFGLLGAITLVVGRLSLRNFVRGLRRRGHGVTQVLAVGDGPNLDALRYRTERFPELGLKIKRVLSSKVTPAELIKELRSEGYELLVLALPKTESRVQDELLHALRDETISIQLLPDLQEYITLGCTVGSFDGLPIIHLNDSPLTPTWALAKRATDFTLSLIALLVLSPLLILVGLMVRLTSRGPALYGQERMGLDGVTFKMYKFRSMRVDAEQGTGAVWAKPGDDRRTPIGSFLRATSLDELPQLWNVFKGDMSLVGPRPERPVFVDQFKGQIPHYMLRHKVKAGLTGWAAIHGWRGNTSLEKRIEFDLYYIRNWSYGLDMKIMLLTVVRGFIHKNAY